MLRLGLFGDGWGGCEDPCGIPGIPGGCIGCTAAGFDEKV